MGADTGAFKKILQLEVQKGFADNAVMGGLDHFLSRWAKEAATGINNPDDLLIFHKLKLSDPGYARMTEDKRRKWVTEVLAFLPKLENQPAGIPAPRKTVKAKPAAKAPARPKTDGCPPALDGDISLVKGISAATAPKFHKMGINTVRDLLYYFPNRHLDYSRLKKISQLEAGSEQTIIANVWQSKVNYMGGRRSTEAVLGDDTGNMRAVWFNNPYMVRNLKPNARVVLSGRVSIFNGRPVFESPEWEELPDEADLIHTGRLVPVYPLTAGLHQRSLRRLMKNFIDISTPGISDFLPEDTLKRNRLLPLAEAIRQAHFPDTEELKDAARNRLAFDELFILQLGVLAKKKRWQEQTGRALKVNLPAIDHFISQLPFKLTDAQTKCLADIKADISKSVPMSRLLQGEVGSGKTIVAVISLFTAAANGLQGAFMAPTEILAEQHFKSVTRLFASIAKVSTLLDGVYTFEGLLDRPLRVALMISDMKSSQKDILKEKIKKGEIDIAIGTHALIQKEIRFKSLGLAVIDEQHRFGVEQRSALRSKGLNPHILIMTATPIPRTLALTLYGELDLSVIDELPPGRQSIKTRWLKPEQRNSAYNFIRKQIEAGRQAFIICPLVEESEAIQAKAATAEYETLSSEVFPESKVALLHGRMNAAEKESIMKHFNEGKMDILVSTPVVEVGIDIPNATVMLVESADRFGLSQLHQFRGRVGRGTEQSYCMFLAENPSLLGQERLSIIESTQDGFKLAEEDLRLRGPGEFFGTRQSGLPDLRMASISDVGLLEQARREATRLFESDPELNLPENKALEEEIRRVWPKKSEWS
ncbi:MULTISPECIES: ATP-dependent DNA helicase RecG [Dehalococcoides]|uniref:ATP-dependent DNA helicase RecG n=1 Tax=Dehalococcoides TaxID=61434 RepID=UPI002FC9A06F